MNDIKVSILCTTYNHEKFIKQALDSFLSQKVSFKTEILIHDDCSTDGTLGILKEYSKIYKNISLFTEKNNQYSKNNFQFINDLYIRARGQYVAFCEGDDYWIDNHKLQKQVEYLDKKTNHSLCFHPVKVVFDKGEHPEYVYPEPHSINNYSTLELLKRNYIQTNSVLYRRLNYNNLPHDIVPSDWYMHLYHAAVGKIGFINEIMSVYRRHSGGVWWDSVDRPDKIWNKYGLGHINLYHEQLKLLGNNKRYRTVIYANLMDLLFNILTAKALEDKLINNILKQYPNYIIEYLRLYSVKRLELESANKSLELELSNIKKQEQNRNSQIAIMNNKIENIEKELHEIKKSKAWMVIEKYRKLQNIFRS